MQREEAVLPAQGLGLGLDLGFGLGFGLGFSFGARSSTSAWPCCLLWRCTPHLRSYSLRKLRYSAKML